MFGTARIQSLLQDSVSHVRLVEEVLSDDLFEQKTPQDIQQQLLSELSLSKVTFPHKAYLLALVRGEKVKKENICKVIHEFKQHGSTFDNECIYCKYSQYALKESLRIDLQKEKQLKEQGISPERIQLEMPLGLSYLRIGICSVIREERVKHLHSLF